MPKVWTLAKTAILLAALPCVGLASGEGVELGKRLSEDATILLEELLGPGSGHVIVTVEGENRETVTEANVDTPIKKTDAEQTEEAMPGYSPSVMLEKAFTYVQRNQERSTHVGFAVTKISVSVLLDERVPAARAQAIKNVLSDALRLSALRGDTITIVPARLSPPWRSVLLSPQVLPRLIGYAVLFAGLLLALLVLYVLGRQGTRALVQALLARRTGPPEHPPGLPPAAPPPAEAPPLPGEEPPSLLDLDAPEAEATLASEVSFDFLERFEPDQIREVAAEEAPGELALLFSFLADRHPERGTRLFSALDSALRVEVSRAMVRLSRAEPEQLAELETRLKDRLESRVRGPEKLGRLLSRLGPEERTSLLGELSQTDADASERIREALVTFEDLAEARDETLRRLLSAAPLELWSEALHQAAPEFHSRVEGLLPAGLRPAFRESVARGAPQPRVLDARFRLLSLALELSGKGEIEFKKPRAAR